jgi:hypothetical protein
MRNGPCILGLTLITMGLGCSPSQPTSFDAAIPFESCFEGLAPRSGRFVEVQSYTGPGLKVQRARTPGDGIVPGETFPYEMIRFALEAGTEAFCVSNRADLTYHYQHHNWNDSMEARVGSTVYRLTEKRIDFASWEFELTTVDASTGTVRGEPQKLADAGCFTIPFDLNGCPGRMRTDR